MAITQQVQELVATAAAATTSGQHDKSAPWIAEDDREFCEQHGIKHSGWVDVRRGGQTLGSFYSEDFETNRRHARLAAAAPTMLAALQEVESFLDNRADVDDGIPNDAMRHLVEVRAALAKAGSR